MTSDPLQTLFLALEQAADKTPQNVLFLYAPSQKRPGVLKDAEVNIYNPLAVMSNDNIAVLPRDIEPRPYDLVLALPPKNKDEMCALIGFGCQMLDKRGTMIVSAANDAGGKSLEREMKVLDIPLQSVTKHKSRAVILRKDGEGNADIINRWAADISLQYHENTGMWTYPGLFAWDKIDRGSKLLKNLLPETMAGQIADFGCGHGYLTKVIQSRLKDGVIHAIDKDARAVDATKKNTDIGKVRFRHEDATRPVNNLPPLDTVVMNPPFHTAKKPDISLGQGFIMNAAHHLKEGGVLYMVANRHLAYEKTLRATFSSGDMLAEQDGFKIFRAVK